MKFGVSEIARKLNVDRNLVKTWAYHFEDYLSSGANPKKATPRQFTQQDLRVLTYVYFYWEDNPDFECIKIGLNRGEYESERYNELITEIRPIFDELPDDLDETWRHVCIVGGISSNAFNMFTLAESYKLAGDTLVEAALSTTEEPHKLIYPIIYNYRHATELYLKALLSPQEKTHELKGLLEKLRDSLNAEFSVAIPSWFEDIIMAFNDFDPGSTTFRYGEKVLSRRTGDQGEFCINLLHIKQLMDWMTTVFHRIRQAE